MVNYSQLIAECESYIRGGLPRLVAIRLAHVVIQDIPREMRLPLANICRRTGLLSLGLKLLSPIVHPKGKKAQADASPLEIAGYSMLLLRSGAVSEAMRGLNQISPQVAPEVLLYRSFAHFLNWEFSDAVPLLEQYLKTPLSPYATLVAKSNLAYAQLETRHHEAALTLLSEVITETAREGHVQLQSAAHVLRTQVYVQDQNLRLARHEIDQANQIVSLSQGVDHFSIMKWKLILDGLENRNQAPFDELRKLAVQHHDWEALREADFHSLKVDFNAERFSKLYFGSPFLFFRKVMADEFGRRPKATSYVLGTPGSPCLDLKSGQISGRRSLNAGRKRHQMICALLKDFYRPLRIGGLFSELFPAQHFDISSSPDRVRQIVSRTRRWLKSEKVPARIQESDNFYSFAIDGHFSVRLESEREVVEPFTWQFEQLRARMPSEQSFLAKEVESALNLPKWTVHKFIKWGIESGRIKRLGDTQRVASYILAPLPSQKKAA